MAAALFVPSLTLVAVTVYTPAVEAVKVADVLDVEEKEPPVAPHVTPWLRPSLETVAVNDRLPVIVIAPRFGVTETVILPVETMMVMVAAALLVLSVTEVAVSVTVAGVGTAAGAL